MSLKTANFGYTVDQSRRNEKIAHIVSPKRPQPPTSNEEQEQIILKS